MNTKDLEQKAEEWVQSKQGEDVWRESHENQNITMAMRASFLAGHAAALDGKIAVERELFELLTKAARLVENLAVSENSKNDAAKLVKQAEKLLKK